MNFSTANVRAKAVRTRTRAAEVTSTTSDQPTATCSDTYPSHPTNTTLARCNCQGRLIGFGLLYECDNQHAAYHFARLDPATQSSVSRTCIATAIVFGLVILMIVLKLIIYVMRI